ncbi:hypothetical protein [Streptomyces hebeiensis]
MAYFNFNYVTDPPNDEQVDPITQLNENWEDVNDKIRPFQDRPTTLINPPKGTEAFYPESPSSDSYRIAVYNGTSWCRSLNHSGSQAVWQALELRSPYVARTGFPPVAKIFPFMRYVILSGSVQISASATPWPTNTSVEITTDTAINSSLTPVNGGFSMSQCATGQVTAANGFASAVVWLQAETTPTNRVAIRVRYQGDSGGGNFVSLDGMRWWY